MKQNLFNIDSYSQFALFVKAKKIAWEKHANQKYGDYPYSIHLFLVVNTLQRFGFNNFNSKAAPLLIAALLHDTVEDTDMTMMEIENDFGKEIAEHVWAVTDDKSLRREERKIQVCKKLQSNAKSIPLKLADRIANLEFCVFNSNIEMFEKYKAEHTLFKEMLYPYSNAETSVVQMWEYLEFLFKHGLKLN